MDKDFEQPSEQIVPKSSKEDRMSPHVVKWRLSFCVPANQSRNEVVYNKAIEK